MFDIPQHCGRNTEFIYITAIIPYLLFRNWVPITQNKNQLSYSKNISKQRRTKTQKCSYVKNGSIFFFYLQQYL